MPKIKGFGVLYRWFLYHWATWKGIRSVAQSCPTLCDPMNRSTPGLPVPSPTPRVHWDSMSIESVLKCFLQHNSDCHHVLIRISSALRHRAGPDPQALKAGTQETFYNTRKLIQKFLLQTLSILSNFIQHVVLISCRFHALSTSACGLYSNEQNWTGVISVFNWSIVDLHCVCFRDIA